MSNVVDARLKPKPPTVGGMRRGEVRWTVPWAYDEETGDLDLEMPTHNERAGSSTLQVTCVEPVGRLLPGGLFRVKEY